MDWTDERELEILDRCEAATPGPWVMSYDCKLLDGHWNHYGTGPALEWDPMRLVDDQQYVSDAIFIANARADLPAAVAEIRRLRSRVAELEAEAERFREWVAEMAAKAKEAP